MYVYSSRSVNMVYLCKPKTDAKTAFQIVYELKQKELL